MVNKFDYQNMLNTIRDQKISKNKTPQFTDNEISAWNNAIDLCHSIVERRREKFETSESNCNIHSVSNSVCLHEFVSREYASQPYGTCMICGKTVLAN